MVKATDATIGTKITAAQPSIPGRDLFPSNTIFTLEGCTLEALVDGTLLYYASDYDEEIEPGYTVVAGVSRIEVSGLLVELPSWRTRFDNVSSLKTLTETLARAEADPLVLAHELIFRTPGGEASGMTACGDAIFTATKPTVAYIGSQACSGGYWLASQCDYIVSAPDGFSGSIGAYRRIDDTSEMMKGLGIKSKIIKDGEFKGMLEDGIAITKPQEAEVQRFVDFWGQAFAAAVARGRGVDMAKALEWKDGRTHTAPDALLMGLIDQIGTDAQASEKALSLAESAPSKPGKTQTITTLPSGMGQKDTKMADRTSEGFFALVKNFFAPDSTTPDPEVTPAVTAATEVIPVIIEPVAEVVPAQSAVETAATESALLRSSLSTAYCTEYNRAHGAGTKSAEKAAARVAQMSAEDVIGEVKSLALLADRSLSGARQSDPGSAPVADEATIKAQQVQSTKSNLVAAYGIGF